MKVSSVSSLTDIGRTRDMNQDYLYASAEPVGDLGNLFLVADGMGGHNAGDFASRSAIERITAFLKEARDLNRGGQRDVPTLLKEAILDANRFIFEEASKDVSLRGMGTTIVAAVILDNRLYAANVGDSRLYVIDDQMRQITRDHSLVWEMVRLGELDSESARNHPDKNIITRAVGVGETVKVDTFERELRSGSTILLCSDGLTNMVDDRTIFSVVKEEQDPDRACARLVQLANDNGGRDNITLIAAAVE